MMCIILLKSKVFSVASQNVFHLYYICRTVKDLSIGLESLESRRLIADLTMIYKIVHNLVDVDRNELITLNSTSVARNSLLKLYKQTSLSSVRAQFLCMRCINAWNYLSEEAKSSTSVSALKKSVYLQLNNICIRFINVLLIQDMCQCFRYDRLYVPRTCHSLLIFHFLHKIVYVVLSKINKIQYTEKIPSASHLIYINTISSMHVVHFVGYVRRPRERERCFIFTALFD